MKELLENKETTETGIRLWNINEMLDDDKNIPA